MKMYLCKYIYEIALAKGGTPIIIFAENRAQKLLSKLDSGSSRMQLRDHRLIYWHFR